MQIDLRRCETLALSLPEEAARRESVSEICSRLGLSWRLMDGIAATPGWLGCGLSHLRALRMSTPGTALLILEDDIGVSDAYSPIIEVPADADAIYLGASTYGAVDLVHYVGFSDMVAAEEVDDRLVRVYNLLGAHAILYLTDRFRQASAEMIVTSLIDQGREHDKGMAKLQETFTVYALRQPMFFQAGNLQKAHVGQLQEVMTRTELNPSPVGMIINLGLGEIWRAAVLTRDETRLRWLWLDGGAPYDGD